MKEMSWMSCRGYVVTKSMCLDSSKQRIMHRLRHNKRRTSKPTCGMSNGVLLWNGMC